MLLLSNPLINSLDIISVLLKDYFCPVEGVSVPITNDATTWVPFSTT
jgi:hypothetical protein